MEALETQEYYVVVFSNGEYFNGVKGHLVRRTKNFLDAKRCQKQLSDRDERYLEGKEYELRLIRVQGYLWGKVMCKLGVRINE